MSVNTKKESKRDYSLRRVFRKLLLSLARHSLVPSRVRVLLFLWAGVQFSDSKTAFIGSDVYIDDTHPELVSIGKYVRLTSGTKIITHFFDISHQGTEEHPFTYHDGPVEIADYVFIGMGAVIAKSVKIGPWAVIGANSVVTRDVPPGAIYAGNPANIVGYRKGFGPEDHINDV